MKQVKKFARLFDTENGQILVTKINHPETQSPSLEVRTIYEAEGYNINPSSILQYEDCDDRDIEFDGFEKLVDSFQKGFDDLVKSVQDA